MTRNEERVVLSVGALFGILICAAFAYTIGLQDGRWTIEPPRFVAMSEITRDYIFRGSFVEVNERARWTEVRL